MLKRVSSMLALTVSIVMLTASCVVVPGLTEYTMTVNGDGHLTQDAKYVISGSTFTFNADGSYIVESTAYNTVTDAVETISGDMGSYVYEPQNAKLTYSISQIFDSATDTWVDTTSNGLVTSFETNTLLTDHNIYYAYIGSISTGSFTFSSSSKFTGGAHQDNTTTFNIGMDLGSLSTETVRKRTLASGAVSSDVALTYRRENSYKVGDVTPETLTKLTPGTTFTMYTYSVSEKMYYWSGNDYSSTPDADTETAADINIGFSLNPEGTILLRSYNGSPVIGRNL